MSNILKFLQTDQDTISLLFSFITKGSCATRPSVVADNAWSLDRLRDLTRKGIVTALHQVTFPLLSLLGHCLRNRTYCNKATVFRVERSASTVCNDKHSLVWRNSLLTEISHDQREESVPPYEMVTTDFVFNAVIFCLLISRFLLVELQFLDCFAATFSVPARQFL